VRSLGTCFSLMEVWFRGSKQQELVVLSMTEGEYVAATHALKEALWLRSFTSEVFGSTLAPTTLFSDNKSTVPFSIYSAVTRHRHGCQKRNPVDVTHHGGPCRIDIRSQ
jgi:hypothetical protein